MSWLQKYDAEMGDKQAELDEFTDKLEEEERRCRELEVDIRGLPQVVQMIDRALQCLRIRYLAGQQVASSN